jgi:hypothetical protein
VFFAALDLLANSARGGSTALRIALNVLGRQLGDRFLCLSGADEGYTGKCGAKLAVTHEMVGMPMRVDEKAHGLVGHLLDFGDDLASVRREAGGIDDEDTVIADDSDAVAGDDAGV